MLKDKPSEIDDIDSKIASLLSQRHICVREIGKHKRQHEIKIKDENREAYVLERVSKYAGDEGAAGFIRAIYQNILEWSRKAQAGEDKENHLE